MKVIDQINGSALFAQSAFSASIATKDNLGRDITATYLTGINIPESATWNDTSDIVKESSASWNQGKTYEGISPIVVNNDENKVSADTWTFSAGSNVSFVDDNVNKITRIDCSVTGEGGDPQVNSFVYENSATILDVDSSYKANSGTFLTAIPSQYATTGDIADLAQSVSETYYPNTNPSSFVNEDWVTAQGYITGVDLSEYAKRAFVLSSIESATSGKLDVSSFAGVSSDFLTNEDLNGYATESFVQDTSANITALIPTTTGFALKSDFTFRDLDYDRHYLTGVSGYNISAAVSDRCNVATIAQRDSNGNYITYTYYTSAAASDLSSMLSGAIDYVSGQVDNKLDTTSFSDVSGSFLTAVDLSPYQTIEGMTAYQPVGDYATTAEVDTLSSMLSGAIDYVSANAGDEFPVSADEAIQYVQTNSAQIDDTVTSYQTNSGTFLTEPNLEYNAVDEISGIAGSAIAQYGAEKQWLQHDDTLVHAANSAQYALGVAIDNVARLMGGVDRTVLFDSSTEPHSGDFTTTEPLTNFEEIEFYLTPHKTAASVAKAVLPMYGRNTSTVKLAWNEVFDGWNNIMWQFDFNNTAMTSFSPNTGAYWGIKTNNATGRGDWSNYDLWIYKVVGVGRKDNT